MALSVKARADLEDAEERLAKALGAGAGADEIRALEQDVEDCRERLARVPFLDDLDLRYRNRVSVSIPMARAVMFCLMDVSGSMDEGKKDLAKRFFTLLYLFLSRKYEHVDLVFIRHTDNAEEVDERTFFYDPKSGGTIVLSALELMREILESATRPALGTSTRPRPATAIHSAPTRARARASWPSTCCRPRATSPTSRCRTRRRRARAACGPSTNRSWSRIS